MIGRAVPLDFALTYQELSWAAVELGIREGWLRTEDAIRMAERRVSSGLASELETELAMVMVDELTGASALTQRLAAEEDEGETSAQIVWMRILLARILREPNAFPDPLSHVEQLYAAFGYPLQIRHLVRYEPAGFTLAPGESHEQRLTRMFEEYVDHLRNRESEAIE